MITEKELNEAIAECQGVRNPNSNTCIKLASYYTILDHIVNEQEKPEYSYSSRKSVVDYYSNTEFSQIIGGRNINDVLEVVDELMETLQVVNPRLYASVIRKLESGL